MGVAVGESESLDRRSVRLAPPRTARPSLLRERLIEQLNARWRVPVTAIVAGAGFGKTTLLGQAIAENRLDPRGEDYFVACRPEDAVAAMFGAAIAETLGEVEQHGGAIAVTSAILLDVILARAPRHVCLILDDVHLVPVGSPGARFLTDLLDELPQNGHVVLASRGAAPTPLARRRVAGQVAEINETDLLYTEDEMGAFAALRISTPGSLAGSAGWPAMAELLSSTNRHVANEYLWDEVLQALAEDRRCGLAMLAALGGADDELLSAALKGVVDVRELTRGVPTSRRSKRRCCRTRLQRPSGSRPRAPSRSATSVRNCGLPGVRACDRCSSSSIFSARKALRCSWRRRVPAP